MKWKIWRNEWGVPLNRLVYLVCFPTIASKGAFPRTCWCKKFFTSQYVSICGLPRFIIDPRSTAPRVFTFVPFFVALEKPQQELQDLIDKRRLKEGKELRENLLVLVSGWVSASQRTYPPWNEHRHSPWKWMGLGDDPASFWGPAYFQRSYLLVAGSVVIFPYKPDSLPWNTS